MYHKSQLRYKLMPVVIESLQIGQKVYRAAKLSKLQVYDSWAFASVRISSLLPMPSVAEDLGGGGREVVEGDLPTIELGYLVGEALGSSVGKGC